MIGFFKRLIGKDELPKCAESTRTLVRTRMRVPAGHVLPEGEAVVDGFPITVEAGIRWHPEWDEPRITVNAFRFFPHGDCLVWAGESVTGLPVPEDIAALAPYHGQALATVDEKAVRLLASMGLVAPKEREPLGAFILPEQRGQ